MKKILVLGMGYNQIPLIETANRMGLYTIAIGKNGGVCEKYSNKWAPIDFSDLSAVLDFAKKERIDGIISCGTDLAINTAAFVNEKLKLSNKYVSYESAKYASYKETYKKLLKDISPQGIVVDSTNFNLTEIMQMDFPIVFKPSDGGGGQGITVIKNKDLEEVINAFNKAERFSKNSKVIVEQFIVGQTLGVESFVINGDVKVLVIPEKNVSPAPECVTNGVLFPATLNEYIYNRILEINNQAIKALGINWGPTHIDIVLDNDGTPFVIDVGARLAGGPVITKAASEYYNYDFVEATIKLAIDEMPEDMPTQCNGFVYGSDSIRAYKSGKIIELNFSEEEMKMNNIRFITQMYYVGEDVNSRGNDGDRLLIFTAAGKTKQEVSESLSNFKNSIKLRIE